MRAPALSSVLRSARATGLRPFEIFAEGKAWIDKERKRERGLVDSLEARIKEDEAARSTRAQQPAGGKRGPRAKPAPAEDEAVGVGRDLSFAKGVHSHLLELRRAAISRIKRQVSEREEEERELADVRG